MKKFLAIAISAVMALSMAGCGNAENTSVNSTANTPSAVESSAVNDIYNLYDYENDKVFYVDKLDLKAIRSRGKLIRTDYQPYAQHTNSAFFLTAIR